MKKKKLSEANILPKLDLARARTNRKTEIVKNSVEIDDSMKNMGVNKKYFIRTYGCQMNENDSEKISAILEKMHYESTDNYEEADVILLNTCAIREGAEDKVFGFIGQLKHLKTANPNVIIGICGCMPQEESTVNIIYEKYQQIDLMFGTHNIHRLPELLKEAIFSKEQIIEVWSEEGDIFENMPVKREFKHKAWVTIMFGCDRFCTYCIVPYTRGKERSRMPQDIIEEVKELIYQGYQEITLLGQNVNSYGIDFDFNYTIDMLVAEVAKLNVPRIKIMTSNPWNFTDELIDVVAKYDNVMPFIHLPIQSGNDEVLKLMGRRHTAEEYIKLFDKIKAKISNVSISTDIIVGFPNETDEQFEDTLKLSKYCQFDQAFTFIYSKREGTPAAKMTDTISEDVKKARLQALNKVINESASASNQKFVGQVVKVLVDGVSKKDENVLSGYNEQNKIVNFVADQSLIGKIVDVKIEQANTWSLYGKLV